MNAADAIAQILKIENVEQVFWFPFTPIIEALAEAGIRPIVARQERVAENMADGFSRTTNGNRLGVVTVQQSAGAENAFAGIAQARSRLVAFLDSTVDPISIRAQGDFGEAKELPPLPDLLELALERYADKHHTPSSFDVSTAE